MKEKIEEMDVVALKCDRREQGLIEGQVGTVVEILSDSHFEVEFVADDGSTYAMAALPASDLLVLHYSPVAA